MPAKKPIDITRAIDQEDLVREAKKVLEVTDDFELIQRLTALAYLDTSEDGGGPLAEEILQAVAQNIPRPAISSFRDLREKFSQGRGTLERIAGRLKG